MEITTAQADKDNRYNCAMCDDAIRIQRNCHYPLNCSENDPENKRLLKETTCPISAAPLWVWTAVRAEYWEAKLNQVDLHTMQSVELIKATKHRLRAEQNG